MVEVDGLWEQPGSNIIWTRCSVGKRLKGDECVGDALSYSWQSANKAILDINDKKYLGFDDWRLPHISELYTLINCSTGFDYKMPVPDLLNIEQQRDMGCKGSSYLRPTIDSKTFPQALSGWYWSNTLYNPPLGFSGTAWGVYFSSGYAYDSSKENEGFIFLVRDVNKQ